MLRTKEQLIERQGKYGTPRFDYLQRLVTEFQETEKQESKEQILAHLGNFAYDPINYEHIRTLHVIDLFLDCLEEDNMLVRRFAISGLCNLSCDPLNIDVIAKNDGIPLIIKCLTSADEDTVLCAITALIYLETPATRADIMKPAVTQLMHQFADATEQKKISNLAKVFLEAEHRPRYWRRL
eukprot:TRINITY_DN9754_c0_g1_i1.p1 TRINITY_DN9754_c0_g1~~TRINITY_DN9754_c0_g1_i1.p1  ORF type:complete len:182 (-),score=42.03 TRINITY_DN9754_c0_g1_i1:160-705(-)